MALKTTALVFLFVFAIAPWIYIDARYVQKRKGNYIVHIDYVVSGKRYIVFNNTE